MGRLEQVDERPNPGSNEAVAAGCTCPRMDNSRGRGWLGGNGKGWMDGGLFVVVEGCPLHSASPSPVPVRDTREEESGRRPTMSSQRRWAVHNGSPPLKRRPLAHRPATVRRLVAIDLGTRYLLQERHLRNREKREWEALPFDVREAVRHALERRFLYGDALADQIHGP